MHKDADPHSSTLWCEGVAAHKCHVGCSCTAEGPRTVSPKEGQRTLTSDTQSICPARSVLDPSTGAWLRAQWEPGTSGAPCQHGAPSNKVLREVKLVSVWLCQDWSLVPPPSYSQASCWAATQALFPSAAVDVEGHPCPTLDTAAGSTDQSPNTMGPACQWHSPSPCQENVPRSAPQNVVCR